MGKKDKEAFRPKEFYRERIIEMVKKIDRTDILNYIYIVVSDIVKEKTRHEQTT